MLNYKNHKSGVLILSFLIMLLLVSCMKEKPEPPKSMEQIQEEEGVPVQVVELIPGDFSQSISYFATLEGYKQTTKPSPVHDKIVKINAKVGDNVEEGKVIIEFPKDNPILQYEQAKVSFENAEKNYNRMKELHTAGDVAKSAYEGAETQYLVSKRNYNSMLQMVNIETPISGTIISMPVREGDYPKVDDALFTVAQLHKLIAKVKVSDREIGSIKKGMSAIAIWNGKKYNAKVSEVALAMDAMTRSFQVEIEIDNSQRELKSGVTAEIHINTMSKSETITVTRDVITQEGDNYYVFLENGGKAHKRLIRVGNTSGNDIEVLDGLFEGDRLINCCISLIEDGTKIKVIN